MVLISAGLKLTEVAQRIVLRRDVVNRAPTPPRVAPAFREMDVAFFPPGPVGFAQ